MIIQSEITLSTAPAGQIDLLIGAVGYETRSTWLLETAGIDVKAIWGLKFDYNQVLHFDRACEIYAKAGADVMLFASDTSLEVLTQKLSKLQSELDRPLRVALDISAMSRLMIATTLLALTRSNGAQGIELNTHYTPANYRAPGQMAPVRVAQPIVPELAGWSSRPDTPLGVIIGLGYEGSAAAGALQVLEPSRTWALYPVGFDLKFLEAVHEANDDLSMLFDVIKLTYSIADPAGTRSLLRRLLSDLRADYRVALVPFGPKIFSWLCMVTALENGFEEVAVWRFSAQELGQPVEYEASGTSVWHQLVLPGQVSLDQSSL